MRQRNSKIRYFVKTGKANISFFPWGFVGVLCTSLPLFYGLSRFASSEIEENTRINVENALAESGLQWVKVAVDGQNVVLSGRGPQSEGERALDLARESQGDTWLGAFTPAIKVTGQFEPSSKIAADQPLAPLEWGGFQARLNQAGKLALQASVASTAEERALIQSASLNHYTQVLAAFTHDIVVKSQVREGSMELAMLASELLSHCQFGSTRVDEGTLSLDCQADPEGARAIQSLRAKPLEHGKLGDITVNLVKSCTEELKSSIQNERVNFEVDSNALPPSSTKFFDTLANLMRDCKAMLRIDGHTDDSGSIDYNMLLSFKRAMAAVDALAARGIDAKYLVPKALGPSQPRNKAQGAAAKAENRRIEFYLILPE